MGSWGPETGGKDNYLNAPLFRVMTISPDAAPLLAFSAIRLGSALDARSGASAARRQRFVAHRAARAAVPVSHIRDV